VDQLNHGRWRGVVGMGGSRDESGAAGS